VLPVTFKTQVTADYGPDGAGRHLANLLRRGSGLDETADRAVPGGADLDAAIEHARAALAALLRVAAGGEGSPLIAEARILLVTLLEHRIDLAAGRLARNELARNEPARDEPGRDEPGRDEPGRDEPGGDDAAAVVAAVVAAVRADRDEAIAVAGALLYWLPPGDPAWPEVALTVGRLSYDRYRDPWPQAEPPDPDDLDAACDLLLRAARYQDADERTTLYLVLALRDRQRLLSCPSDTRALTIWGERLMSFRVDPQSRPYSAAS
jgi:hypothetical protein